MKHGNLEFSIGKLHYEPKEIPWILIIGGAIGSLLAIVIFMVTLVVYCRKANANERLVRQLEQQRDTLEMKVAKECKEGGFWEWGRGPGGGGGGGGGEGALTCIGGTGTCRSDDSLFQSPISVL